MRIEGLDLNRAISVCINEADETIKDQFLKAIRSTKPSNLYREALLACALANYDEKGYFNASDINEQFSRIMGKETSIPYFARHLKEFCSEERGPVLHRAGKQKSYEYRFRDPLLRPYVVLRGIADGILGNDLGS
jgi:hypothetical protein